VTQQFVIELGREALITVLLIAGPALIAGMTVGLVVSVFQAVTQIQEFTLTFVPKIIGVITVFVIAMPWMLNILLNFVTNLLSSFQAYTR